MKAKNEKCLTCARNARVCSRAQECHAARGEGYVHGGRTGGSCRRCRGLRRSRHEDACGAVAVDTKQSARRCAAPRERSEGEFILSFCHAPTLTQIRITPLYSRSPAGSTTQRSPPILSIKKVSDASKIDTSLILKVWTRSSRGV